MTTRELRVSRGMSLRQVASASNISPTFLSLVESGKSKPSPETAKRILDTLKANREETESIVSAWTAPLYSELARWDEVLQVPAA